jgi:hypothetical protein
MPAGQAGNSLAQLERKELFKNKLTVNEKNNSNNLGIGNIILFWFCF